MSSISAYLASSAAALQQTIAMSVADMAMNGSAAQMQGLVEQISNISPSAPAVDGLGANIDVKA